MSAFKPSDIPRLVVNGFSAAVFHIVRAVARLAGGEKSVEAPVEAPAGARGGKKTAVTVGLLLLIAAALISIPLTMCERTPAPRTEPFVALGQVAAEETAKLLGNQGKIALIVMEDERIKTTNPQLDAFTATLKKQGQITVAATEKIVLKQVPGISLDADHFLEALQKYHQLDAIVSFAGSPNLTEEQINSLSGQKLPKFVSISNMGIITPGLKKLFENQIIHLAITPRLEPSRQGVKKPSSLREWFDQYFLVVTPENASALAF